MAKPLQPNPLHSAGVAAKHERLRSSGLDPRKKKKRKKKEGHNYGDAGATVSTPLQSSGASENQCKKCSNLAESPRCIWRRMVDRQSQTDIDEWEGCQATFAPPEDFDPSNGNQIDPVLQLDKLPDNFTSPHVRGHAKGRKKTRRQCGHKWGQPVTANVLWSDMDKLDKNGCTVLLCMRSARVPRGTDGNLEMMTRLLVTPVLVVGRFKKNYMGLGRSRLLMLSCKGQGGAYAMEHIQLIDLLTGAIEGEGEGVHCDSAYSCWVTGPTTCSMLTHLALDDTEDSDSGPKRHALATQPACSPRTEVSTNDVEALGSSVLEKLGQIGSAMSKANILVVKVLRTGIDWPGWRHGPSGISTTLNCASTLPLLHSLCIDLPDFDLDLLHSYLEEDTKVEREAITFITQQHRGGPVSD
ncbi:hypothetical protein B0H19DRAFT_1058948 [Mycena capillaripes]|nr:hypothetical protein B0H19DRAFT_1058948 [Mycena capillaripes]